MNRLCVALVLLVASVAATSCAGAKRPALQPAPPVPGAVLWEEPADIATRDLYYGPWGRENAPDPAGTFTLVELKRSGVNPGMTVEDERGREWSVKTSQPGGLDSEGPVEVVVSRLLSAVGYRQPPVYHLPSFRLKDDFGIRVLPGGRFRLKHDDLKEEGLWQWEENPFVGTRPYQGLLVMLTMFNSTDMKNSNNSVYRYQYQKGDVSELWYVVRDIGSALGDTNRLVPRKNNIAAFAKDPFIVGVDNAHVEFAYHGWYRLLVQDRISPAEVEWAGDWLSRLSEGQWRDAFRAGGYPPHEAAQFIAKIKDKIEEGRGLSVRASRQ